MMRKRAGKALNWLIHPKNAWGVIDRFFVAAAVTLVAGGLLWLVGMYGQVEMLAGIGWLGMCAGLAMVGGIVAGIGIGMIVESFENLFMPDDY